MPIIINAELVEKEKLNSNIYKYSVKAEGIAGEAKAGQFLEIRVTDNIDPLLRRPISIYNIDRKNGIVEFIFQVRGKGTELLARKNIGDLIDIIGPLGYGDFKYEEYNNISIIGGGIGNFPLYELAKNAKKNANVNVYLGFRNKDFVVLEDEFRGVSNNLIIATDDGSYGKNGLAIDLLKEDIKQNIPDCICACGPIPMLRAVKEFALKNNIPCQVSLEELMGCGIGACLGCAIKVVSGDEPRFGHVCKEGPVFFANEVEF